MDDKFIANFDKRLSKIRSDFDKNKDNIHSEQITISTNHYREIVFELITLGSMVMSEYLLKHQVSQ